MRTDAEGLFRLELACPPRAPLPRRLELLEPPPGTRGATVVLEAELAEDRDTDLGDVVLVERLPEILASGLVVDQHGPVAGAEVSSPSRDGRDAVEARTDAAGRFELLGVTLDEELPVTARSPDHLGARPLTVLRGAHDVVFSLERAPRLTIEGLRILRLERVELLPDGRTEPSLRPIDLRGRVRLVRLELEDEEGEPLEDLDVRLASLAGSGAARTGPGGRIELVVPSSLARLELAPHAFEPVEVALASGVQVVSFRARTR